ncbi:hypothetical protein SAY87_024021 [Trapa incisa]|uniref:Uncharacterized protein n=1 Tax=Trapa incisa TaxID=236973 RepID=A0AAN7QUA4_9MYRT|nr:hypothetical protein SAY87_024021 [Trapa incisa]
MKVVARVLCVVFFALMASICWFGSFPAEATGRLRFPKLPRGPVPPSGPSCNPWEGRPGCGWYIPSPPGGN